MLLLSTHLMNRQKQGAIYNLFQIKILILYNQE